MQPVSLLVSTHQKAVCIKVPKLAKQGSTQASPMHMFCSHRWMMISSLLDFVCCISFVIAFNFKVPIYSTEFWYMYLPLLFATDATLNTRFTLQKSWRKAKCNRFEKRQLRSQKFSIPIATGIYEYIWYIYYTYIWYMRHLNDVVNFYILEYLGSYFGKEQNPTIWDISTFKSFLLDRPGRHPQSTTLPQACFLSLKRNKAWGGNLCDVTGCHRHWSSLITQVDHTSLNMSIWKYGYIMIYLAIQAHHIQADFNFGKWWWIIKVDSYFWSFGSVWKYAIGYPGIPKVDGSSFVYVFPMKLLFGWKLSSRIL